MRPQLLFVGPTRSGTTWIDAYLRRRGDVLLPRNVKETFFFDKRYDKGLAWYESRFDRTGTGCCVEVAPSLFHKEQATARVAADLPDVTVVCTLRDPVERAVSHYFHYRRAGEPTRPFEELAARKPDVIEAGLYHKHLTRWYAAFGPERVRVLFFEDLKRDPGAFARELCRIMGLPWLEPDPEVAGNAINASTIPRFAAPARLLFAGAASLRRFGADRLVNIAKATGMARIVYGTSLEPDERDRIVREARAARAVFTPEVERLELLLGRNLASWK